MRLTSIISVLLCAFSAQAQSSGTSDVLTADQIKTSTEIKAPVIEKANPRDQQMEKINVTGSRIKRIDVEGPSPVMTIDRDYMDQSGYNSVADVLRDTTVSSFGVEREYSDESNSVGAATIGLRGLSSDQTLILLDGRRLPKIDGGNSVDLNLIPFEAIERIEILKDGASAIYGSDALAGVINFITKKDYDGASIKMRHSQPELRGGQRQEISATYGKNFNKGNFLAVYQYRNNHRIMDRDRDWSKGGVSTYSSPPSLKGTQKNSLWQAAQNCPENRVIRDPKTGESYCSFDYSVYTSNLPDTEQHSAMLRGTYELNGSTDVFANTTYTNRQVRWQWAPSADKFADNRKVGGKDHTLPAKLLSKPGANTSLAGPFEARYRTVQELGPRSSRDTTNAYGAVVGVRGQMMDTWEWETSANYGLSELNNLRHAGYGNRDALFNEMVNGKGNLFGKNSDKGFLPEAHHVGDQLIRSTVSSGQFVTSGNLADFSGGQQLNMATGFSGTWESYSIEVDEVTQSGQLWGGIGDSGRGDRNYQSAFTELGFSTSRFEALVAGRFDNYSDFGGTVNPKLSLSYSPLKSLMFRGSAGTGFRAPSLDQLYRTENVLYPFFKDTQACDNIGGDFYCAPQQYEVYSSGNPNLKEETSVAFNLGTVVQPTQNWSISLDYWETRVNNAVGMDFNDLMFAEGVLGNNGVRAAGVDIQRDNTGAITTIVAPELNLARKESKGLEFMTGYTMKFGALTIRPQMDHSHLLENNEEPFPGMGLRAKLGEFGRPRWRNTSFVTFGLFNHGLRLMARTIAGTFKQRHFTDPTFQGRIPNYTEYDIHYEYAQLFGGQFSFGVKNLFATNRPLDETAGFDQRLNAALFDQVGRLFYTGYNYTF